MRKGVKLNVKAVIFDMDGVITDTMPFHLRAWKRVYTREGISATHCEIYLREGQPGMTTVKEMFQERGIPFDRGRIKKILDAKEKLFKKIVKRRFIPGARPLIHFLKKRGFKLALVTGTARHEVTKILPKGLLEAFDITVTGDEVKRGKPHPEPYLTALKKLGLRACDAVVIENAPFGIHSARRARLLCFALETSLSRRYLKDADRVFPSFKELRKRVRFDKIRH